MQRDGFGLHFVPISVDGVRGLFLVDSGASHTVLDHRFAKRALSNLEPSNLRLAWLGSKHNDTQAGVLREIRIGNYVQQGPFKVYVLNLDAINHAPSRDRAMRLDGILGADFLISHGALIDYASQSLLFTPAPYAADWLDRLRPLPTPLPR